MKGVLLAALYQYKERDMKRIGLVLLACSVVCLIVGVILFPTQRRLIVNVNAIANAIVWFVLGYLFGQAGLLVFIAGLNSEQLKGIELKIDNLAQVPVQKQETASSDTQNHAPGTQHP